MNIDDPFRLKSTQAKTKTLKIDDFPWSAFAYVC